MTEWTPTGKAVEPPDMRNSEALYDSNIDEEDAKWVSKEIRDPSLPTDAVLNCAGCFTTLCYQCQRHESYHNQWRATHVMNVVVDRSQQLSMGEKGDTATFFGVTCEVCKAEVAVLDKDEVYHLFNVVQSHG